MATTTHTMIVKLSYEVVFSLMRWLFREATTSFSLLALSPPHHQKSYVALHGTIYGAADMYRTRSNTTDGFLSRPVRSEKWIDNQVRN
jgi:hypothetical protein